MADELDFTSLFSAQHKVAEPAPSADALRGVDELGTIGEAKLKSSGFYTRIVSATPAGRARAPAETLVLIVEDDELTGRLIETRPEERRVRNECGRSCAGTGRGT